MKLILVDNNMFTLSIKKILQSIFTKKAKKSSILNDYFVEVYKTHFPGGAQQIHDQANEIIELSNGKLNFKLAKSILIRGKGMLSYDKSKVYDSVKKNSGGLLNKDELESVIAYIMLNSANIPDLNS
jgi:hypothetical protein